MEIRALCLETPEKEGIFKSIFGFPFLDISWTFINVHFSKPPRLLFLLLLLRKKRRIYT
jgi:hypothetical protein